MARHTIWPPTFQMQAQARRALMTPHTAAGMRMEGALKSGCIRLTRCQCFQDCHQNKHVYCLLEFGKDVVAVTQDCVRFAVTTPPFIRANRRRIF